MSQLIAILYRSDALSLPDSFVDTDILAVARARNAALNVTGILHRESGTFYQWLEGPADAVRAIFASITDDKRHANVVKLWEIEITERHFRFWSMVLCNGKTLSIFDWAAKSDISLHRVKPHEILAFLLSCARRLPRETASLPG